MARAAPLRRYPEISVQKLLVAAALFGVLAWIHAAPSVARCATGIGLWSLVGALWGLRKHNMPIAYGAIGGGASVFTFIVCGWLLYAAYTLYNRADGVPPGELWMQAILASFAGCALFGPIAAAVGALLGTVIWLLSKVATKSSAPLDS